MNINSSINCESHKQYQDRSNPIKGGRNGPLFNRLVCFFNPANWCNQGSGMQSKDYNGAKNKNDSKKIQDFSEIKSADVKTLCMKSQPSTDNKSIAVVSEDLKKPAFDRAELNPLVQNENKATNSNVKIKCIESVEK